MNPDLMLKFYVVLNPAKAFDFDVYAATKTHFAVPSVMADRKAGLPIAPVFTLAQAEAQALADALWEAGIRPTGGHGSAGERAAMQRHLDDMRKLVFERETKP